MEIREHITQSPIFAYKPITDEFVLKMQMYDDIKHDFGSYIESHLYYNCDLNGFVEAIYSNLSKGVHKDIRGVFHEAITDCVYSMYVMKFNSY